VDEGTWLSGLQRVLESDIDNAAEGTEDIEGVGASVLQASGTEATPKDETAGDAPAGDDSVSE